MDIPAGLIDTNSEVFYNAEDGELYAIYRGKTTPFFELPDQVIHAFREECFSDEKAMELFDRQGVTQMKDRLFVYVKCKYGGLNGEADWTLDGVLQGEYWNCNCHGNCALKSHFRQGLESVNGTLSNREVEVIREIATGKLDKEIASDLFISENTLNNHKKSIQRKTGCTNKVEIANYANRKALVQ